MAGQTKKQAEAQEKKRRAGDRKRVVGELREKLDALKDADYDLAWARQGVGKEGSAQEKLQLALVGLKAVDSPGRIGLALSGGGYRASLFHVGALWRLNELGWLPRLDYITSVSGGSIVAGFLGMRWSQLAFEKVGDPENHHAVARNFESKFVKPMREMFSTTIDVQTIVQGLLNPWGSLRGKMDGKSMADGTVGLLGEVAEKLGGDVGKSIARSLARPFAPFVAAGVDTATTAWDVLNPFPTPPELLIKSYDRLLFEGKTLQDLPKPKKNVNPEFVLYATNMQTGVSVRMSREELSDYKLGKVKNPDVPLARAVAASSGFPPFYCPVEIKIPLARWSDVEKERPDSLREKMDLADGAVYDNMGLEKLIQSYCETILVSDAGDALDVLEDLPFEWLSQAIRTLEIAMSQVNKLRWRMLNEDYEKKEIKRAYWGISKPIDEGKYHPALPPEAPALLKDTEQTRKLGEMRTRLNEFTDEEQERLINWGYALADARMRQYVIAPGDVLRPGKLPFPSRSM